MHRAFIWQILAMLMGLITVWWCNGQTPARFWIDINPSKEYPSQGQVRANFNPSYKLDLNQPLLTQQISDDKYGPPLKLAEMWRQMQLSVDAWVLKDHNLVCATSLEMVFDTCFLLWQKHVTFVQKTDITITHGVWVDVLWQLDLSRSSYFRNWENQKSLILNPMAIIIRWQKHLIKCLQHSHIPFLFIPIWRFVFLVWSVFCLHLCCL